MYISKKELLEIAKDHKIRGCNKHYKKTDIINVLKSKGLISDDISSNDKDPDRYKFLKKNIRHNNKTVRVRNLETGNVTTYSSIYKCAKALKVNAGTISFFNNRLMNDNLEIQITDSENLAEN